MGIKIGNTDISKMYVYVYETVHVTGVSLNKSSINLTTAGDTEQLVATITPANADDQTVTWSSSNTTVATVSQTGLVTCVTPGTATITATTQDGGYTATCGVITNALPSTYQAVEYIENTGNSCINTNLVSGIGYRINLKFYTSSSSPSDQTIIGGAGTSNTNPIYLGINYSQGQFFFAANNGWTTFMAGATGNTYEMDITLRNGVQEIISNGTTVYTDSASMSGSGTTYINIFRRNNGSNYSKVKLYSMQVYDSTDTMVRNFVPCYRISDTEIGLYDTVNGVFYTNAGSGTFSKGADV